MPPEQWQMVFGHYFLNVTYVGKNAREFNWSRWTPEIHQGNPQLIQLLRVVQLSAEYAHPPTNPHS